MQEGDAASWFMIKKTTLGFEKNADLGFLGNTLLHKVYLATYICIILFIVLFVKPTGLLNKKIENKL